MKHFQFKNNELYVEKVQVTEIANQFGTPCYIYSRKTLEENWHAFNDALGDTPHQICYAVKANSNIAILNLFARLDSGFDIVSVGELERVLAAGGDPEKIVFSGVGKHYSEITRALQAGISCFNIESEAECERLQKIAAQENKIIKISLRINPNIDALTHPYIATGLHENKFGIEIQTALEMARNISSKHNLKLIGVACHIGSQITDMVPFLEAIDCLIQFSERLVEKGFPLQRIDIGGGLGISYHDEKPPSISEYISKIKSRFLKSAIHENVQLVVEPGRALVANAGILVTQIEYLKYTAKKNFIIVDAGMNDFIRPALYQAWQNIVPIHAKEHGKLKTYDIVGPVCESADFLGKDRLLAVKAGDLLAVCQTGAYGFSMSSNYNSRPRPAEVLVDGHQVYEIRRRETIQDLFAHEKLIE